MRIVILEADYLPFLKNTLQFLQPSLLLLESGFHSLEFCSLSLHLIHTFLHRVQFRVEVGLLLLPTIQVCIFALPTVLKAFQLLAELVALLLGRFEGFLEGVDLTLQRITLRSESRELGR